MKKIKWGIVGLGRIAKLFAEDLMLIKDAELVAVASHSVDRAQKFADEFECKSYYGSYQELFNDPNVDIVYIATMHHTHCEVSIEAMSHGKHVLCEKPIAINKWETQKMVEAAEKNQVFLMEAFWSRFNPSITKIKQMVDRGELGTPKYLNAEFTFYVLDQDPEGRMLNVNFAGGSLLDMGVYPIFLSYLIFGKPQEILARSQFFETGAEIQTSMIFQYENAQAILYSGFANDTDMKAKIAGDKAEIYITPIWHETQGFTFKKQGWEKNYYLPTLGKGFAHEIIECHKCIENGMIQSMLWSHENSFDLISIVDEVRSQAGILFPFETQR